MSFDRIVIIGVGLLGGSFARAVKTRNICRTMVLLRDFETAVLEQHAQRLRELARGVAGLFPGVQIVVGTQRQYRNLREGLSREPRAVAYAVAPTAAWGAKRS